MLHKGRGTESRSYARNVEVSPPREASPTYPPSSSAGGNTPRRGLMIKDNRHHYMTNMTCLVELRTATHRGHLVLTSEPFSCYTSVLLLVARPWVGHLHRACYARRLTTVLCISIQPSGLRGCWHVERHETQWPLWSIHIRVASDIHPSKKHCIVGGGWYQVLF